MAELTEQEKALLVEMRAEELTEKHIRDASNFIGSMPYTHMALLAIAKVCRFEFEHDEMAQLLEETAEKVAELECQKL